MASSVNFPRALFSRTSLIHALQGAGIALCIGLLFFYGDGGPLEFGFRIYVPLLTASIGGALGGLFYSLTQPYRRGNTKVPVLLLCALVYVVTLWISSVAGLAVTGDWN